MNFFREKTKFDDNDNIEEKKEFKYELPKILAVDIEDEYIAKLKIGGFNIEVGTFGQSYKCKQYDEVEFNGSLPCITEKDIIIVDLNNKKAILDRNEYEDSEIKKADRVAITIPQGQNCFNPSYFFAKQNKENFEKVLKNSGIIIIFSDKMFYETYYLKEYKQDCIRRNEEFQVSNYDWMPKFVGLNNCINGKEVFAESKLEKLKNACNRIISENKDEILYTCNFGRADEHEANLFSNNLGESLGYIDLVENNDKHGFIVLLPQFKNKAKVVITLFEELIVGFRPDLFPQFVQNSWLNSEEYLLPEIKKINENKKKIEEEYGDKIKKIDNKKVKIQEEQQFLTNILVAQGYDEFLVDNIKKTLEFIGYKNIVDVDKEIEEGNRQEDLRILDYDRFDIVEIKGHKGSPTEDDCQAVVKYMSRKMKQLNRTDIHGILIVNHNRLLPPLERKNPAFTDAQIEDAKIQDITLVSTWELYKSVRLLQESIISFEDIDRQLHISGLYQSIPNSWRSIGKIEQLYRNKTIACFYLDVDIISKNDEIIIQDNNDYFIQKVEEIMINKDKVDTAIRGQEVSIKMNNPITKSAKIYLRDRGL